MVETRQKSGVFEDELDERLFYSSALRNAYERLALSEKRYRELYDNAPDMYHTLDIEGNFVEFNPKHMEVLGYTQEELDGHHITCIIADSSMPRVQEGFRILMESGHLQSYEVDLKKKDGSTMAVEVHAMVFEGSEGRPKEVRCIMRDVTARKQLEAQLRQAQKMESIGLLAGGVAHDFNNLLTAILGHTQLGLMLLPPDHQATERLQQVVEAAERAATLTRQLLGFSRRQIIDPKVFNLNTLVLNMERMLCRLIGENIQLTTSLAPGLANVKMDPSQMEQVLMNLVVNARDAMPSGGKLTVQTANVALDEEYARWHVDVTPGEYVMLAVSDTGVGMTDEVKAHLFEPFFTTKEPGKGTGLGLSMCYGIVKQNQGHISVASEVGRGTTFSIYVPRVDEPATASRAGGVPVDSSRATGTVLLVEDERSVRGLAADVLRQQGYTVLEATDGAEALQAALKHSGKIDLVIADVVMPNMSGGVLAERLRAVWYNMKILFTSGYTDDAIVHQGVLADGVEFIEKPFSPGALVEKVKQVLSKS
jgi:PAS domain S-box-containing protein